MKVFFFRILLTMLEKHIPGSLRSIMIQILLNTTAQAFDRPKKMVWTLSGEKALAAYADYTTACMKGQAVDRKRVYQCACRLGRRIRRITGFSEKKDLERLLRCLYSTIGIELTGHLPREIIIPVCYFSHIYTPGQCRVMSLMDWGIISGVCGGGKLVFRERLTQGCGRCRAYLKAEGSGNG